MKSIRYARYTGDDFGLSAEDLLKALSDFFLESGFDNPYMQFGEFNQNTLEDLKRAIEEALERGDVFDPERAEQIQRQLEAMSQEQLDQLLSRLVQKLVDEGYITTEPQNGGRGGDGDGQGGSQGHRQERRFSGLQDAEGPARLARPLELRRARHARYGHRRRSQRRVEGLRIRRHDEPGRRPDAVLGDAARRAQAAAESGIRGPARASERVSKLLRHGADARLQPQHDSLRRGPLHARQESRAGAGAPDPHAVSRRLAALRAVSRFGRGTAHRGTGARAGGPVLHQHARRPDLWPSAC